jgi:hypothetical protein
MRDIESQHMADSMNVANCHMPSVMDLLADYAEAIDELFPCRINCGSIR